MARELASLIKLNYAVRGEALAIEVCSNARIGAEYMAARAKGEVLAQGRPKKPPTTGGFRARPLSRIWA